MDFSITPDERDRQTGTTVFVLGAGCSADCGSPVMTNFMRTAREFERRVDCPFRDDYRELLRFRQACMKISYVLDRWWENIEDLFTQAHLMKLMEDGHSDALQLSMLKAVWDVYRRFRPVKEYVGYDNFSMLLMEHVHHWIHEGGPRPVVVTTNYDVHLETTLIAREHPMRSSQRSFLSVVYPGVSGSPDGLFCDSKSGLLDHAGDAHEPNLQAVPRAIEIAKLHGSVNWFKDGDDNPTVDTSMDATVGRYAHQLQCQSIEYASNVASPTGLKPLIVPPLLGKISNEAIIADQWKRAVHAFRCAREVFIIGYSFPQTDTFMTRLLAQGIRENEQLERIRIINKTNEEGWWNALEGLFSRSWWRECVDRYQASFFDATEGMLLEISWYYARCFRNEGFDENKKVIKLESFRRRE